MSGKTFKMRILFFALVCVLTSTGVFAQSKKPHALAVSVPLTTPNLTENGKRQGKWAILLNEKKSRVDSVKKATYYRVLTYKDDKPTGFTEDYYLNGKLQMRANLVADRPFPKYEGKAIFYRPNGKKDYEEIFENGKSNGKTYFNLNGSAVKEDWEKWRKEGVETYFSAGKYAEALEAVNKSKRIVKQQFGTKHPNYAICLTDEGSIYLAQQNYAKGEKALRKALEITKNSLGKDHEDYLLALTNIGNSYNSKGLFSRAAPFYREALQIAKAKYKNDSPLNYALPLNNLAAIALNTGQYPQADSLFTEATNIFERLNPTAYAIALNNLIVVYYQQAKYQKADSVAYLSLQIQAKENKITPYRANTLNSLAASYIFQGKYARADSLFTLIKAVFAQTGEDNTFYTAYLANLATSYMGKAQYAEAAGIYKAVLLRQEKTVGKLSPDYATVLSNLGMLYIEQGQYRPAEAELLAARNIFEENDQESHPSYATALLNLAELYREWGKYTQAEAIYTVLEKYVGEQHPSYAVMLTNMAVLYAAQSKYAQEAPLRLKAIQIAKRALGEKHPDYATLLNGLAQMYESRGEYAQVDSLYRLAIEIAKNALGVQHPDYAINLSNLGTLYFRQSNYTKAESLLLEAVAIFKNSVGEAHPYTIQTLQSLAQIYLFQGEYEKAETLLVAALQSSEKVFGKNSESYAFSLKNLADVYYNQSDYAKARPMYEEAAVLYKNVLGEQHANYAGTLGSLAIIYSLQKQYAEAEPLFEQVIQLYKEIYGEKHPEYANILGNWADSYRLQKEYGKAIPLYEQALDIISKAKGENHPDYATLASGLAVVYRNQYIFEKATPLFLKVAAIKLGEIQNNLSNLSENGKQKYLAIQSNALTNLPNYLAHVLEKKPDYKDLPKLLQAAFNLQLQTKGLLLSETQKVKNRIFASKDSVLIGQMERWQAKKNFIAKVYNMTPTERKKRKLDPKKLETEANELEKALATRSADFQSAFNPPTYTYQDIQKTLGENEAAIEMIKGGRINWAKPEPDTTFYYLALILTQKELVPVLMDNGREMDNEAFNYYRASVSRESDETSYGVFWEKIAKAIAATSSLAGVGERRIYFSPDGIYHNISLNTLFNTATKKYLLDEFDIQLVTNLKELMENRMANTAQTASLFGRPAYGMSQQEHAASTEGLRGGLRKGTRAIGQTVWRDLEYTEKEIVGIDETLRKKDWQTAVFLGKEAVEERVKQVKNPAVLHIATHGYFESTSKKQSDAMLNAGIVLAGVNTAGKGENSDDGILTALEATNLNLDQTDLVVLSACETGLGEVANGEGIYGLQRGFKVAGAKSIIMSLWRVSDSVTQEFMQIFYKEWLSGKTKREAFKDAQTQIKSLRKYPYFWGAFVMVGD